MKRLLYIFLYAITFLLIGCGGKEIVLRTSDIDDGIILKRAEEYYNRGKYDKALAELDKIRYSSSVLADDAHLLAAKVFIKQRQYEMAVSELKWLLGQYAQSDKREEASFLLGETYRLASPRPELDDDFTKKAIDAYNDFLDRYPSSSFADSAKKGINFCEDKLAHKIYLSAELYYKLKQDSAVVIYINYLREKYPTSRWILWADYLEALVRIRKKDAIAAKLLLEKVLASNPEASLRKKAENKLLKISKK